MRQTSEQIDRAILDAAAHTFATHGFARTSVQQLADAVGYSKTGLLHRFANKQALYDAAVDAAVAAVEAVLAGQAHRMLDEVAELARARPGLVELVLASTLPGCDDPARDQLHDMVKRVIETLAGPEPGPERRLRSVLALRLIVDAVLCQSDEPVRLAPAALQRLTVELAAGVLGS